MANLIFVGLGGFFGSISRFLANKYVNNFFYQPWLPYGTLTVNIVGCFLIGFLYGFFEIKEIINLQVRAFIFIGFLGGFTTFSTFGYDAFGLAKQGLFSAGISYILLHIVLGLFAVWAGDSLARLIYI